MNDTERAKLQAEKEMLAAKLQELEKEVSKEPTVHKLDEDDNLRLENIILKERLFETERQNLRNQFYARLVKKYDIDLESNEITVDAQTRQLIIQAR